MGLSTVIPALIFGFVGLIIIGYSLKLILAAVIGNPWSWLEQQRIYKKERMLRDGDRFLKESEPGRAAACWQAAFFLDRAARQLSNIDRVHNLNMNLLGRLIGLAERRATHIINLPILEELFAERNELLHMHFETSSTLRKLRLRKKDASGKKSPDWALQEFSKKHGEVKQKLDQNRRELDKELKKLFESLSRIGSDQGITYH